MIADDVDCCSPSYRPQTCDTIRTPVGAVEHRRHRERLLLLRRPAGRQRLRHTATASPSPPPACGPAWVVSAIYTAGATVSHLGRRWTAQWWTTGEEPGTTGQWGV